MNSKIFYSWQSDLPNATNRTFIQTSLERAAKEIQKDESISVEPVVDRDTQNVPGSPDIAATIFKKIDEADVFVCDVSIVNKREKRPTPNPNVLLELGYALKTLGEGKIITVMNRAFGEPELLPFDLKLKRVTTYNLPKGASERKGERDRLEKVFVQCLLGIYKTVRGKPGQDHKEESIEELAIRIGNEYKEIENKKRFLESYEGVVAANQEVQFLQSEFITAAYKASSNNANIKFGTNKRENGQELNISSHGYSLVISWENQVVNSVEDASLYIEIWKDRIRHRHDSKARKILEDSFKIEVDNSLNRFWSDKKNKEKIYTSKQMAELYMKEMLRIVDKYLRERTGQ